MTLLTVSNLDVTFDTLDGPVEAVQGLRFTLGPRETLGIVGESGSGKSQAVLAMLGLLAANGRASGSVRLDDMEILNRSPYTLNRVRGRRVAMVFQDPMTSLNPYLTIGRQLALVLKRHRGLAGSEGRAEILRMLDAVRLPQADRRLSAFPHEFSGGMRQRVMIASALLCRPEVLIADEPTTALDVTVQASILELLRELRDAFGTAVILISHDLAVVAGNCDQLVVMRDGIAVEKGLTKNIFRAPEHDYTRRLIAAVPRLDVPGAMRTPLVAGANPIVTTRNLSVRFGLPRQTFFSRRERFDALAGVSVSVSPGETLGIVGESGCGKSTLARSIIQLVTHYDGEVTLLGRSLGELRTKAPGEIGRDMQMVFQDPLASLNPRMTIGQIVAEPLRVHHPELSRRDREEQVAEMLRKVGLDPAMINRFPHEFSGGQCQRTGIARALITSPRLLICDEALSALDVSVQEGIVDLLISLQSELGLAILFIAHDLGVVRRICHRVVVMYLGRVVEEGRVEDLYTHPAHPYTRALLDAAPVPDPDVEAARDRLPADGGVPAPWDPPSGCAYRTRCLYAQSVCAESRPSLISRGHGRVACHRTEEIAVRLSE